MTDNIEKEFRVFMTETWVVERRNEEKVIEKGRGEVMGRG